MVRAIAGADDSRLAVLGRHHRAAEGPAGALPLTAINFHLADQQLRLAKALELPASAACLKISTKPGRTATGANHMDVYGVNGPQVLNMLDPLRHDFEFVNVIIDVLIAELFSPLPGGMATYDPSLGGC